MSKCELALHHLVCAQPHNSNFAVASLLALTSLIWLKTRWLHDNLGALRSSARMGRYRKRTKRGGKRKHTYSKPNQIKRLSKDINKRCLFLQQENEKGACAEGEREVREGYTPAATQSLQVKSLEPSTDNGIKQEQSTAASSSSHAADPRHESQPPDIDIDEHNKEQSADSDDASKSQESEQSVATEPDWSI